jgi:hypothetical protein
MSVFECGICYLEKNDFYTCSKCKNKHCTDCKKQIFKCPFCRNCFIEDDEIQFERGILQRLNVFDPEFDPTTAMYNLCVFLNKNKQIFSRQRYGRIRNIIRDEILDMAEDGRSMSCQIYLILLGLN